MSIRISLRMAQTFLGSCELGSNTSSCLSDTGEKGNRVPCVCTEQRGQRVDGPSEGGVDFKMGIGRFFVRQIF